MNQEGLLAHEILSDASTYLQLTGEPEPEDFDDSSDTVKPTPRVVNFSHYPSWATRRFSWSDNTTNLPSILKLSGAELLTAADLTPFVEALGQSGEHTITWQLVSGSIEIIDEIEDSGTHWTTTVSNDYLALDDIFSAYANEEFEPGHISTFEIQLTVEFELRPELVVSYIGEKLQARSKAPPETVLAEALRVLGRLKSPYVVEERFQLLQLALTNSSAHVRDYAALALYDFGDKRAVADLRKAIEREPIPIIRTGLEDVVNELELL